MVSVNAPVHEKILDLAYRLDISENEAFGAMVRLWCWLPENRAQGRLYDIGPNRLAQVMRLLRVGPDLLVKELIEVGLLDMREDGDLDVHGWRDPQNTGWHFWKKSEKGKHGNHVKYDKPDFVDCFWCEKHFKEHRTIGEIDPDKCGWCRKELASLKQGSPKQGSLKEGSLPAIADRNQDQEFSTDALKTSKDEDVCYDEDDPERPFESKPEPS